jgi:2-methylcitrate dehydratase PrpD
MPTEARFSMTHTLAWSLIEGDPTPVAFQSAAISRGDIRDLVSKLSVETYDLAQGLSDMSPEAPDTVTLTLTDGRTINATVAEVKGGTTKQMTDADLRTKLELAGGNPAIIDLIIAGDGNRIFRFAHVLETMM